MPDQTPGRNDATEPVPELLTIAEAAELLRAPVATLCYWGHPGTGPRSFCLGRRVLYTAGRTFRCGLTRNLTGAVPCRWPAEAPELGLPRVLPF
jgi:hypothetical protein